MIDHREDTKWKVYVHIVPKELSGHDWDKYYVGITSQPPKARWKNGRGYKYRKNDHFWNAICKYGWSNIIHEIIAENLTKEEATSFEITLISKLHSYNSKYGYNKTTGGEGASGLKISNKHKQIISQRNKEKWKDKEYRNSRSGKNHPLYGIKRQVCEHEPFKRKVVCLNTKIEYESITYAAKCIGTSLSNIICACSGKDFSAGFLNNGEKLVWEYEENYSGMTLNDIYKKIDRANNFQVVNLSTKEVFINASCAAQHYGKSGGNNIYQAIHGRSKSAYGYKWQYLNDYLKKHNLTNEEARNSLFFIK